MSATGLRLNASFIAPSGFERRIRRNVDALDGWGALQPIVIPFTGPLDVRSITAGHRDPPGASENDVLYLIDVTRGSPTFGQIVPLDLGNGNYPVVLEKRDIYWKNDPRVNTLSLLFEETDEDTNGDGLFSPEEDSDADGVFDKPNYYPGANPDPQGLAQRTDALMTFYERETNSIIARPLVPLRERTTYAVVVTRRILDEDGKPVGSPFPYIHHLSQTEPLRPLLDAMPEGLKLEDVAFAWTFTTQTLQSAFVAVRDGLYGIGPQKHLADFKPEVEYLSPARDWEKFPDMTRPYLMYGENWARALDTLAALLNFDKDSFQFKIVADGQRYVDFYVLGRFKSPQLFPRNDAGGKFLNFDDQKWPEDLHRVAAPARSEDIWFTLAVPRREVSARGQGKPAPLMLLGHGYGGNRFDGLLMAGYFARYGLATITIDAPSHGIGAGELEQVAAKGLLEGQGFRAAGDAIFSSRAFDQDGDGVADSGADFWSAYLFHTRDMLRQSVVDHMQLVRVLRAFDGERRWKFDVDNDGVVDLDSIAGDLDGDGQIDVGGTAPIRMVGGSMGGMICMLVGSLEPEIDAIAPLVGGGGLGNLGVRSVQSGVPEAFILRALSPMYAGTLDAAGRMLVETIVTDSNDVAVLPVAHVEGVRAGDTMLVVNEVSGERGCGLVDAQGRVRAAVASDEGDRTRIEFFRGARVMGPECEMESGLVPIAVVDKFEGKVTYQGNETAAGSPLTALTEGLGLSRASPGFRRMQGIGQMVLDAADPAVFARHLLQEPLVYGTGARTGAHSLMIFTAGDMSVPNDGGMTVGRAAGLIDYMKADPRYGKTPNQVLIDTRVAESTDATARYPGGVHMDVENFSNGDDDWGASVPRLDPPLRLGLDKPDALGGKSAALFPLTDPHGKHGFELPGAFIDNARNRCKADCTESGANPCGCNAVFVYDPGNFIVNMAARYIAAGGAEISTDLCQSRVDCAEVPQIPSPRPLASLE
jgi:hypothetical protein